MTDHKDNNASPTQHPAQPAPSDLASQPKRPPNAPSPSDLASLEQKIRDLAKPRPIYTPTSVRPTHALKYDWSGWLSNKTHFPPNTCEIIQQTAPLWNADGLQLSEFRVNADRAQILFSAAPTIAPTRFASLVKGRLQHALRLSGNPVKFSRKVAFRSLGDNTRTTVEGYLAKQVRKEGFVDPRFIKRMQEFTVENDNVDIAQPAESVSGRYWYNIHLVIVVGGRVQITNYETLGRIRNTSLKIAEKKGYALKSISVMPDHLHIALRGHIEHSPEEIALSFMNNLAFTLGRNRIWQDAYYVGTFSEYTVTIIRNLSHRSSTPATQGRRG
jgi:REP element-mobilizing transposase RayT